MPGHGSPPAENKAEHPNRKVGRVSFQQAKTINPGPLVGTEARDIPNMYSVKREAPAWSAFADTGYHMGSIRQTEGGRWSGVIHNAPTPAETPMFNVRTEGRARAAASALASMPSKEAARRGAGLSASAERRFNKQRGR